MRRLVSRGALAWVCFGVFVYACSGDERQFVDTGSAGEGGEGAIGTGGASGSSSGKGGASGTGTSGDAGGPAGDGGTTSTGGSGNRGGTGGTDPGGAGGEGGEPEPPPPPGRPGTTLVAGGHRMTSASYQLFSITGNGSLPVNSSSTRYRLHGGIVGTTQP